jgi:DNA-binding transcriptional regulator LsrR (DeoR family)
MTMYREILRLHFEGRLSQRDIAASCRCAHSTVKRVLARAAELRLDVSNTAPMSCILQIWGFGACKIQFGA